MFSAVGQTEILCLLEYVSPLEQGKLVVLSSAKQNTFRSLSAYRIRAAQSKICFRVLESGHLFTFYHGPKRLYTSSVGFEVSTMIKYIKPRLDAGIDRHYVFKFSLPISVEVIHGFGFCALFVDDSFISNALKQYVEEHLVQSRKRMFRYVGREIHEILLSPGVHAQIFQVQSSKLVSLYLSPSPADTTIPMRLR